MGGKAMSSVFIRANEVAAELGVSKPYAYKLIQKMNNELKAKGF
jgi:predicted DNA-binding transcriptional regulator AlpA